MPWHDSDSEDSEDSDQPTVKPLMRKRDRADRLVDTGATSVSVVRGVSVDASVDTPSVDTPSSEEELEVALKGFLCLASTD